MSAPRLSVVIPVYRNEESIPRLLDALQGYDRHRLLTDGSAGLTVGIVALPLAMAFAIASGLKPEAGLWTWATWRRPPSGEPAMGS